MEDIDADITLSKLDAAKRQLETAVNLWFEERDAVSIHTLAAAAHRVAHDVATHRGGGAFLLDHDRLAGWGYDPKTFKKALRQAETFFKHAENDPHDTYTFSTSQTESILASAIECFHGLVSERSPVLALFMGWFHFRHSDTLSEAARDRFAKLLPRINQLTRSQFRAELGNLDFVRLVYPNVA